VTGWGIRDLFIDAGSLLEVVVAHVPRVDKVRERERVYHGVIKLG
jgi:hypothetical protein